MSAPTYDELVAALQEFHAAYNAKPWSLDRLYDADRRARTLVKRATRQRRPGDRRQLARRLRQPTGQPPPVEPDARQPVHATANERRPRAEPLA